MKKEYGVGRFDITSYKCHHLLLGVLDNMLITGYLPPGE